MAAKRRDRGTWAKLVEQWDASGLSAEDFADAHDVTASTLKWWKSVGLRRGRAAKRVAAKTSGSPKTSAEPRLLPVRVIGAASVSASACGPSRVEAFVDGIVVRFAVGTDAEYVAALLAAVRRVGC